MLKDIVKTFMFLCIGLFVVGVITATYGYTMMFITAKMASPPLVSFGVTSVLCVAVLSVVIVVVGDLVE